MIDGIVRVLDEKGKLSKSTVLLQFNNRYTFTHRLNIMYSFNFEHNNFDDIGKSSMIKATRKVSYFLCNQKKNEDQYMQLLNLVSLIDLLV